MNPYQNYFKNQVQTASPERVLVMLYDGAIRFLRQARQALEQGDRVGKLEKVSRAVAILTELSNTLDFEKGGEIAENLDGLYGYMIRELTRANSGDDFDPLKVSEDILVDLRDGWIQAIEKNRAEAGANEQSEESDGSARKKPMQAAI
ncbi:MAG: flagellar export chaperone FliS [Thermodesulfobacteriota bacterium]